MDSVIIYFLFRIILVIILSIIFMIAIFLAFELYKKDEEEYVSINKKEYEELLKLKEESKK